MPDLDYYLKLIPSQHSDKPVFVATVKLRIEFYVRMQAFLQSMTAAFDLDGVADGACRKLISRHPHVFGDRKVSDSGEVLKD